MSDELTALERMLEARSVAVVGASVKPGSLGHQMMVELRRGGYGGAIYPVNPGYNEIDGLPCFASIREVPAPVDLAILGVANHRIEQAMIEAVGCRRGQRPHVLLAPRRAPTAGRPAAGRTCRRDRS